MRMRTVDLVLFIVGGVHAQSASSPLAPLFFHPTETPLATASKKDMEGLAKANVPAGSRKSSGGQRCPGVSQRPITRGCPTGVGDEKRRKWVRCGTFQCESILVNRAPAISHHISCDTIRENTNKTSHSNYWLPWKWILS